MSHVLDTDGGPSTIADVNLTPLIDVALVLLLIMMITASAIVAHSIPVDLPTAQTGAKVPQALAITVDARGACFLDGAPASEAELTRAVRRARSAGDAHAVIAADGAAAHRYVVRVIDLLRSEGVIHFALNVRPGERAGTQDP